jgi:ATP-binding cassette, subfamily C (CFTR/MRP), member 1
MSADIDRIASGLPIIHELYASIIETALALWLLFNILGAAVAAPALWIVGMIWVENQINVANGS